MLELLLATNVFVNSENTNISYSDSFKNKERQEQLLEEQVESFSPRVKQHFDDGRVFIVLEERKQELGAHYTDSATPLGASVITIGCTPEFMSCLLDATHHELAHYVDQGDEEIYSLLDDRLSLPDADSFNEALENMSFVYDGLEELENRMSKIHFCQYFSIIESLYMDRDVVLDSNLMDSLTAKYPACFSSYVLQHADLLAEFRQFYSYFDAILVDRDANRPEVSEYFPLSSIPSDYLDDYQILKDELSDQYHELLSFANSIDVIEPELGVPHDKMPEERFAAAVHSLTTGYVGPVVWNPLKFTLTDDLLDYFAEFEFEGEKILLEHVESYRANEAFIEYWSGGTP